MALSIKRLFATGESRSSVMLVSGLVSLLAALATAVVIWQAWEDYGVLLGPRRLVAVIVVSGLGTLLACSSGIWALTAVNRLSGRNALKCTLGYLLDALALAIIGAFIIIAFLLRVISLS